MQKQGVHSNSQYCGDKAGKRLTTSSANGYSQLVIPGWSNVNQEGQDTGGHIRDWRPELAYPSSTSSALLEGLSSMDFGMPQQRYFNPLRPDLNLSSSSSSSASSLTIPKTTANKSRPPAASRSKKPANANKQNTSSWKGPNGPDVIERFIWGGKYECEKLINGEFICLACGKSKTSRPLLVTHLNYHRLLESKRFSCSVCDKAFSRQREVERHEKTHLTKGR